MVATTYPLPELIYTLCDGYSMRHFFFSVLFLYACTTAGVSLASDTYYEFSLKTDKLSGRIVSQTNTTVTIDTGSTTLVVKRADVISVRPISVTVTPTPLTAAESLALLVERYHALDRSKLKTLEDGAVYRGIVTELDVVIAENLNNIQNPNPLVVLEDELSRIPDSSPRYEIKRRMVSMALLRKAKALADRTFSTKLYSDLEKAYSLAPDMQGLAPLLILGYETDKPNSLMDKKDILRKYLLIYPDDSLARSQYIAVSKQIPDWYTFLALCPHGQLPLSLRPDEKKDAKLVLSSLSNVSDQCPFASYDRMTVIEQLAKLDPQIDTGELIAAKLLKGESCTQLLSDFAKAKGESGELLSSLIAVKCAWFFSKSPEDHARFLERISEIKKGIATDTTLISTALSQNDYTTAYLKYCELEAVYPENEKINSFRLAGVLERTQCLPCKGKGLMKCNTCLGTGNGHKTVKEVCGRCHGKGVIGEITEESVTAVKIDNATISERSEGKRDIDLNTGVGMKSSKTTVNISCSECGGSGEIEVVKMIQCSICLGTRKTACSKCDGRGYNPIAPRNASPSKAERLRILCPEWLASLYMEKMPDDQL